MKRLILLAALATMLISPAAFSEEDETPWFNDVAQNHVYRPAVFFMHDRDYIQGYEDGGYHPDELVNRMETLKIILEASEVDLIDMGTIDFPDAENGSWYDPYLKHALNQEIIHGHDDGFLRPADTVKRSEAMKMLSLAFELELPEARDAEWYSPYMSFATENSLLIPVQTDEESYDYLPGQELTRGELADIIYRYFKTPYTGEIEFGIASYYGDSFNGRNTASGAVLDTSLHMAAHKTLPFDTWVRVTNPGTGQSINVQIKDRGPFTPGRIIDLTPASFEEIGHLGSGILNVYVEVLN
ncbi:septal ring lytic transglycosylase RlpA family protein [Candidatus Peregrinibacteria bacterium]|jgi:rare lipoprotein A|nr:septal ring lytic transglycosylase RlpA family protein [Candidatus Peregrinibacteria bacterium]MBT4632058.1 septal ring lytic transglycosylase RlpA family protein [Candidatus Peregrinibacteria bacterium]MBT5516291.1 septal ring lytic transglycosylase RlpA family protein [Candidatus Peregrinibacteria bacterium]MBT5823712.1 septal ring lytic transglycosylase RlpA family protein [Candidatus Peregrinibacteria bacterium]